MFRQGRTSEALDTYREEGLFERAAGMAPYWEEAVHSLKGLPHVIDVSIQRSGDGDSPVTVGVGLHRVGELDLGAETSAEGVVVGDQGGAVDLHPGQRPFDAVRQRPRVRI